MLRIGEMLWRRVALPGEEPGLFGHFFEKELAETSSR
jgi:hypothetical protein